MAFHAYRTRTGPDQGISRILNSVVRVADDAARKIHGRKNILMQAGVECLLLEGMTGGANSLDRSHTWGRGAMAAMACRTSWGA